MSLDVMYLAKNKKRLVILPLAEISEIEKLAPSTRELFDVLFKTEELGVESYEHDKQELLLTVNKLLNKLSELSKHSYKYSISFNVRNTAFEMKDVNNISGLRINNDFFEIKCGSNQCNLIKATEAGYYGEVTDIRDKKELVFDEGDDSIIFSPIKINKRKSPFKLQQKLKKLKQFLESIDDDKLTILIY